MTVKLLVVPSPLSVREDAIRRERGISLARWLDAPSVPAHRDLCGEMPRPCPCLRCEHHIGERGDGSYSCMLDFRDDFPDGERTHERIAKVTGYPRHKVTEIETSAQDKFARNATPEILRFARVKR